MCRTAMLVRHRTLLVSVLFSAAASQDRCLAGLSIPCKKSGCPQYSRCLRPAPVSKQCAFHRDTAREDCRSSKGCAALSCPRRRNYCLARDAVLTAVPTFGDVDSFAIDAAAGGDEVLAPCDARHGAQRITYLEAHWEAARLLMGGDLAAYVARLRDLATRTFAGEAKTMADVADRSTLPPLVLLSPSTDARIVADAPREETIATYRQRFSEHKFLRDAVYVGDHFFRGKTGPARKFLEVGGLTGNVGGSNSYPFERFLG